MYNLRTSNITVDWYELIEKLKIARKKGFKFFQINLLTLEFYARQSDMTIRYYLRHRIHMMHRQFFRKIAHSKEYIESFCNEITNPFQYACRHW